MRLLFGLVLGSFLNVLIHRLPTGESVIRPRSRCPACASPIRWRDNLPILSWLLLGRRCRDCRAPISPRYPLVEALTAIVVVAAPGLSETTASDGWGGFWSFLGWTVFLSLLLALAACDWERRVLPDLLTLPGFGLGLAFAAVRTDLPVSRALLGALTGAGLLWALRALWLRFRRVEALGRGDIKLLLMIGAFLGPAGALGALGAGSVLGLLVAAPLLLVGRIQRDTPLPFGVFLAVSAAALFLISQPRGA